MLKKELLLLVASVLIKGATIQAQSTTSPSVLASSGGDGSSSTHQVSWTIGEPMIETYSTTNHQLTQGFHQTNLTITPIIKINTHLTITAYPNPTSSSVTIEIDPTERPENLQLSVSDCLGRKLFQKQLSTSSNAHQIDLTNYPLGIYLVNLINEDNQTISTYQIIKK